MWENCSELGEVVTSLPADVLETKRVSRADSEVHEDQAMKAWIAEQMLLEAPSSLEGIVNLGWGILPRKDGCGVGLSAG